MRLKRFKRIKVITMKKIICILYTLLFMNIYSSFTLNDEIILNKISKNKNIHTDTESKKFILTHDKEEKYKRTQIAAYRVTGDKIFVFLESKEADKNGEALDYNANIGEFDYAVFQILKDKDIILKNRRDLEVFGAGIDIFINDGNMKFISVGDGTDGMEITETISKDSEYTGFLLFEFVPEKNKIVQLFSVESHSYCSFICRGTEENYEFNKIEGKKNYDLKIENTFYIKDIIEDASESPLVSEKTMKYYTFEKGKYILKKEEKSPKYLFSKNDEAVLSYLYDIYAWDSDSFQLKYYVNQDMGDFGKLFKTSTKVKKDLEIKTYISHKEETKDGLLVTLKHILYKDQDENIHFDTKNIEIIEEHDQKVYFKKAEPNKWVLENTKEN